MKLIPEETSMSESITDPKFDPCRRYIEVARQNGREWDFLNHFNRTPDALDAWFLEQEDMSFWPSLGSSAERRVQTWLEIVAAKKAAEEMSIAATRPLVVVGVNEAEPGIQVPQSSQTAWQLYRAHLEGQGWKKAAVDNIEDSVLHILRRMRRNTAGRKPVKGLVVGHVQSGKTANMAGLISMAADYRHNLFIVLSGTLENLRVQTRNRLVRDLYHPGNLSWKPIEHPSTSKPVGERAQDMRFHQDCNDRHLIVSLKNSSRLEGIIGWITKNKIGMKQMRIVIIDDESDQGGINTANVSKEERSKINSLIVRLVNLPVQSINYVAYTATPASNFLNEAPGESLYPEDFIVALPQADEHFGPVQIFGVATTERPPLGIVLDVSNDELQVLSALHGGDGEDLPESLEDAVLWFLCCVAVLRQWGSRKPVSMLIHTSASQQHHTNVEMALRRFLGQCTSDPHKFLEECAVIWQARISDLDPESFGDRFPSYGALGNLRNYPDFETFTSELSSLVSTVTAIQLDEDYERKYHSGIHVCVDNCANNGITDENEVKRLFYPDPEFSQVPDTATAFIVIGGGTLSRGLTIENLVSTFFLRGSAQADSLMQMGRWFGYRKGYELLPRIWMPKATREKFEFMTVAEEDLRDDLQRFMYHGARPSEFGPRVRVHPSMSWLRPTAKNRMQSTVTADYDFSGVNRQTTLFHDGTGAGEIHRKNREHTETFLTEAGTATIGQGNSLIWRGVDVSLVTAFLRTFEFHSGSQFFSEIGPFLEWLDNQAGEAGYTKWNVVAAGSSDEEENGWQLPGGTVGLVSRSRMLPDRSDGAVSIGALRDPRDLLADAGPESAVEGTGTPNNADIDRQRDERGVGGIPQLLLYLIDKKSKPQREGRVSRNGKVRADLNAPEDIVGVSLWLPGVRDRRKNYATSLTVRIRPELLATEDDLSDTTEEDAT
jgi:hypothetical protein